jgi:hypothetical protein
MRIGPTWANWKFWLKLVGLAFLLAFFWYSPPHVDLTWVAAYLGLVIAAGLILGWVVDPVLARLIPSQNVDPTPYGDRRAAQVKRRPLIEALLLPGEDGFFFVPLLVVGIEPLTAAIASMAYAATHYPEYPLKNCVGKAAILYLIAIWILPNGLGSVIVGHLVVDWIAYYAWTRHASPQASSHGDVS